LINDKLGGNLETISKVSKYYADAFRLVCPGVNIVMGTDLYDSKKEYWRELVGITKHMTLKRTMRTLDIMGRQDDPEKIRLAKLLYPPMQAADIHSLDLDIVHAGMDQRKIHMIVREVFPSMGWKVPVAVHHSLLLGLKQPDPHLEDHGGEATKMSKSDPNSGIFIHNSDDEIKKKINKGWCEEGLVENNPVLEIARQIVFHEYDSISIERPEKFGGNVTYNSYEELEADFAQKNLHPGDLKNTVGEHMVKIIAPIRDKISLSNELFELIKNSH